MHRTDYGLADSLSRLIGGDAQPSPARRLLAVRAFTVGAMAIIGFMIGGHAGFWVGLAFGFAYTLGASIAASHFVLDLHDAAVIDSMRAPETTNLAQEMAMELGIEPPTIYEISVERPQVCVSASGYGRHVVGRIGVSRTLLQTAEEELLAQLMALAMARIWTGEATIMGQAAVMAGLPLQFAKSRLVNGSADWNIHDLECGLSPIGKFFLIVCAPFARCTMWLAGVSVSVLRSDSAALRIGRRRFSADGLEQAIRWLHEQQSPIIHDPITAYNPAEVASFLVSPFEADYASIDPSAELPLWKRARFLITSVVPHLELRIERIRERAGELGPLPVILDPTEPDPVGSRLDL